MSPEQMLGYGADPRSVQAPPTSNMDAYAEFSQGRDFLERTHDPENIDRAITLLESAVGRDPTFVLAQAALGEAYWNKFQQTTDSSWTEKARIAAEEARRLDPDHPAVRYALAVIYHGSGRVEEAMEELNRALALQPNNDDVQALLGKILAEQGSGRGQIRAAVKGNADTGCYKYDIEATGLETLDPVLEIDN
jgi:tetratricopeptide (TPR) repeat protein